MRKPPKRAARVLLLACTALAVSAPLLAAPSTAAAQADRDCWKRVLNDWYDGEIQNTYPIPCYQQAIDHLPDDVEQYSSARDDITRALQVAVAAQNPPPGGGTTTGSSGSDPPPATTEPVTTTEPQPTTTEPEPVPTPVEGRDPPKGIPGAIDKLNPTSADAFPLPLLVLGALAIALVVAGVVGMLWRRQQDDGTSTP